MLTVLTQTLPFGGVTADAIASNENRKLFRQSGPPPQAPAQQIIAELVDPNSCCVAPSSDTRRVRWDIGIAPGAEGWR